jgi:hypothetical protein
MAIFGPDPEELIEEAQAEQERKISEAQMAAIFATTEGEGISTAANIDLSLDDPESFADGDLEDATLGLFL